MPENQKIQVEVAYALPDRQQIIALKVPEGTTVHQAAVLSGIVDQFPQINLESDKMGIWGKAVRDPMSQALNPGERVEIYRPLLIDPKVSRANRAEKAKKEKLAQDAK